MRVTATPSPVRKGKQRLLTSCAVAAGMMALACGGSALAQVAGTGSFATGTGSISNVANTTTVGVDGAQSIINWTPSDIAVTGGAIDFLPNGNTLTFNGSGDYTVLNRFVNGAGGSLSRQIALNGTVNGTNAMTSGQRGGNIWFYNAGGILIGATGVINVGSLVLTTNDIVTTGGLFGPGGTIRFDGAAGSTSAITVNGAINANHVGNPGGSYVALVAPRVVQAGTVRVDGSAAYVAAEQVDIRINSGLFDINVTRGVEGGNAITHTGTTTGPAHQQGDTDQNRIYMVAIPKNDAVTMLVSGAIGYDDALSAQIDPDGAVRLSAGYNIVGGELATTPANATAANITAGDTLFRSNTIARASGAFAARPLQTLPSSPPPLSSAGRFFVEGTGSFTGDASARIDIGAGQQGGATGSLTLVSGGAGGTPGNAAINVTGGGLSATNGLTIQASGIADALTGNARGGTASLTVAGGGLVTASAVTVEANGIGIVGTSGNGGSGQAGNAGITVGGAGSMLTAGNILVNALGRGAFVFSSTAPAINGNGTGGTASLTLTDGGGVGPATLLSLDARGIGGIGLDQSGDGTGGTARIRTSGTTFLSAGQTFLQAGGDGGGDVGGFLTQNGGTGTGGTAEVALVGGGASIASLGALGANALGRGGNASGAENVSGGDAVGGTVALTAEGGVNAQFTSITLNASARAGSGLSPSGTTGRSGNARANNVTLTATNSSTISSSSFTNLFAVGMAVAGENFGTGAGGNVAVNATAGGSVVTGNRLTVQAMGGAPSTALAQSSGDGTGGNVDFLADSGTIVAEVYDVNVSGRTATVVGAGGTAQGGTIDLFARNGGEMRATLDATNLFNASATTGVSAGGTAATGGTIQLIADAGRLDLGIGAELTASGTSGGAATAGAASPTGTGGTILVRTTANAASEIDLGSLDISTDGLTQVLSDVPGVPFDTSGDGRGGIVTFDIQGGALSGGVIEVSANGVGNGGSANGTGGIATFTQTGGDISISDMNVSANGIGGTTPGVSGTGTGGRATINLLGGTITTADIVATANGIGGSGSVGNDDDPANIIAGGTGGAGRGGTATITIDGSAIVDASTVIAEATGTGGAGGDFVNASSFGGIPGTPGTGGNGTGGSATIDVRGGTTTTASSMVANASGIGGDGGNSFLSSSSGAATGTGVGGTGGTGRGGTATIALAAAVTTANPIGSIAQGVGGRGGDHNVGGIGGDGFGGTAQAIVTGFDVGDLGVILDSSAQGGAGGDGRDGNGGNGGNATGGTARARADGAGGGVRIVDANFLTDGIGGNGGRGGLAFSANPPVAPTGGNGGTGTGGTIEAVASNAATLTINAASSSGAAFLDSQGRGGNGGGGASRSFGGVGGDGGDGGNGIGGSVNLIANGGTIAMTASSLSVSVGGIAGDGGPGADGPGGVGAFGAAGTSTGGNVLFEAVDGTTSTGQIQLGSTGIDASGDAAGRVVFRGNGSIELADLDVQVLGTAAPTNNDVDTAASGIFFAPAAGGSIATTGDMGLTTDGSIGIYAASTGTVTAGGTATLRAGDQVDIRHASGNGTAATIGATGDLAIIAGTSISGAPGSLLAAGGTLSLTGEGPAATIGVDRLDAADIVINSSGAASIEHAEATGNFTATAGSLRTGLNSIITGGDIVINSPGAVDLGNSTAGGLVQVNSQSIVFNSIGAGQTVNLFANGTVAGAEGIRGGSIDAGGDITLFANSIDLTGPITGNASFFAFGTGGTVSVDDADVDGTISIFSAGDLTGNLVAGGNIFLNSNANIDASAQANGGYVDGNGILAEGNLFVVAAGSATLTDSAAARMLGVNAGTAASIDGATAGEDILVLAGTTANLTDVTGGDDVTVRAPGTITARNVRATGAGADTGVLDFSMVSGSPIFSIVSGDGTGADIVMTSANGAIDAATLSAGDDILLTAAGSIDLDGATTLGLGTTGGDSSIRTQGGATTLAALDAFSDIFVIAAGSATLTDSAAGRMFGVNADAAVTLTGGSAGEDMLILAGTTANLTDVTGGDDITVRAPGTITARNVRTTGAGPDTQILDFSTASGSPTFTIGLGEGTDGTNGADIVMASTAGTIDATTLSAGDDILLNAAGSIGVNGATTLGLGTTGGDSSIRTQGGATTLAAINAFSDVIVDAAGLANLTGTVAAGRDATINAQDVRLATLTGTGGAAIPTLAAGGNVVVNSSAGIAGGGVRATGDVALTAGTAIGITAVEGQNVALIGAGGVDANAVTALGTTLLDSANGNIRIGALAATGTIDASARAIRIEGGNNMNFAALTTDAGDAYVRGTGNLSVATGNVAGAADLRTQGATMDVGTLAAASATLANTGGALNLGDVTAAGGLSASALTSLGVAGVVTGQSVSLASADIAIGAAGRVGTAGITQQLSVTNSNSANQTFIGGTGTRAGYHLGADEMARLYGTRIEIVAPEVQAAGSTSVGSAAPPDVIVDGFTMTGGASNSNLGANGALTIRTPGKMRVTGNVQLTGLTDANALNLLADDALEVILGQGTVRLTNGPAPAGQLNMVSADIIVATPAAIADVGAATTIGAINTRLAENDGVVLDEGALFARGIRADVAGGFYVQNSGSGTGAALRRGLTFGAGGLDVRTQGPSRIVINGVQLGPNGPVTGLDTIALLTIGGTAPVVGTYDRRSTFNGCFIANTTACITVAFDFENNFPVQDVIEEETESEEREGSSLPVPLITTREIDPLTGEPLLDDPVTGAGNDDLWTPPAQ